MRTLISTAAVALVGALAATAGGALVGALAATAGGARRAPVPARWTTGAAEYLAHVSHGGKWKCRGTAQPVDVAVALSLTGQVARARAYGKFVCTSGGHRLRLVAH